MYAKGGRQQVDEGWAARAAENNGLRNRAAEAERAVHDREFRDRRDRVQPEPLTGFAAQQKFREYVEVLAPHKLDGIMTQGLAAYNNYTYTSLIASRSGQVPHANKIYVGTLVAALQGLAELACGGPDACGCAVPCVPKSAHATSWAAVAGQVAEGWTADENRDCRDMLMCLLQSFGDLWCASTRNSDVRRMLAALLRNASERASTPIALARVNTAFELAEGGADKVRVRLGWHLWRKALQDAQMLKHGYGLEQRLFTRDNGFDDDAVRRAVVIIYDRVKFFAWLLFTITLRNGTRVTLQAPKRMDSIGELYRYYVRVETAAGNTPMKLTAFAIIVDEITAGRLDVQVRACVILRAHAHARVRIVCGNGGGVGKARHPVICKTLRGSSLRCWGQRTLPRAFNCLSAGAVMTACL